ncbi:MAG: hypothetical protein ACHQYO_06025 [Halanaerobiales bacterium]
MKKSFPMILLLMLIFFSYVIFFNGEIRGEEGSARKNALIIRTGRLNSTEGRIEGSDGVVLIKGDVEIKGEKLLYFEKEKRAEISGGIKLTHEKGEISSQSMEAFVEVDRYIFREEVKMLQRLEEGDFNLSSPYLELLKESNSFRANRGVVINFKGRTLKGEEVFYNDQEETLELVKNVYIEEDNGDWVKSERAVFYLKTEEFIAEGNVELELDLSTE